MSQNYAHNTAALNIRALLIYVLVSIFILIQENQLVAQNKIPDEFCISAEEEQLFNKLNTLFEEYGKKPLKLSASLSYVAKLHVDDLMNNRPDTSICNLSSWSDKGEWTSCCHNPYVPQQDCMWDKPKELTTYPYRGYELASFFEDEFTVDSVIKLWSSSKQVLDMLLTRENYKEKKWICMGVGLNEKYVSLWFGQRPDRAKVPEVCNDSMQMISPIVPSNLNNKPINFYLVIATLSDPKDANEAVKRYKKNGFENSGTLKNGDQTRVYIDHFTNLKEAMYFKQQLPYTYREAWIYKE